MGRKNLKNLDELHYIALFPFSLQSMRDLNASHVDILQKTKVFIALLRIFLLSSESSIDAISRLHSVPKNKIAAFFHYPPSFYCLHIHFTLISTLDGPVPGHLFFFHPSSVPNCISSSDSLRWWCCQPLESCMTIHVPQSLWSHYSQASDFYQRADLTFILPAFHPLSTLLLDGKKESVWEVQTTVKWIEGGGDFFAF